MMLIIVMKALNKVLVHKKHEKTAFFDPWLEPVREAQNGPF